MSLNMVPGWLMGLPHDYIAWWKSEYERAPVHILVETALILLVLYIAFVKRAYDPSKKGSPSEKLSEDEVQRIIDEWEPEPLVPPAFSKDPSSKGTGSHPTSLVVTQHSKDGLHVEAENIQGKILNLASSDFLGLGSRDDLKTEAARVLEAYTCGSCGPRGFYGTTDKHLELEDTIARFMGTPESITYSDATSTVVSAIPAFAKRGDLLIVDSGVNHAVQNGCRLSRGKVVFFEHNNMDDLKRVLDEILEMHKKGKINREQRRFIVVEGLYSNHGDVCPLDRIVALKEEYAVRLILDDSCGWCVLGKTGRGTVEHFGLSVDSVDVLLGSLSNSMASVGGFCVGNREVVDHQRLSGAGYCFSASCPPFLCAIAKKSLELVQQDPAILEQLRERCQSFHEKLVKGVAGSESGHHLAVRSKPISPIIHLSVSGNLRKHIQNVTETLAQFEWTSPMNHLQRGRMNEVLGGRKETQKNFTHGRYAVSGFEDTITGTTSVKSKTPSHPVGKFRLHGTHEVSASTIEEATICLMYREIQDVLNAICAEALDMNVLTTHSRYLATDSLAPEPTLKLYVSANMNSNHMDTAVNTLQMAVNSVVEHYETMMHKRLEVLRAGIELNQLGSWTLQDLDKQLTKLGTAREDDEPGLDFESVSSYATLRCKTGYTRDVPVDFEDDEVKKLQYPGK